MANPLSPVIRSLLLTKCPSLGNWSTKLQYASEFYLLIGINVCWCADASTSDATCLRIAMSVLLNCIPLNMHAYACQILVFETLFSHNTGLLLTNLQVVYSQSLAKKSRLPTLTWFVDWMARIQKARRDVHYHRPWETQMCLYTVSHSLEISTEVCKLF